MQWTTLTLTAAACCVVGLGAYAVVGLERFDAPDASGRALAAEAEPHRAAAATDLVAGDRGSGARRPLARADVPTPEVSDTEADATTQAALDERRDALFAARELGTRMKALHALAELASVEAAQVLADVANDPTLPTRVRREAMLLLVGMPGEVGYETFLGLLDSDEFGLRLASVQGLGALGRSEALGALSDALYADSSSGIARAIVQAMGQLGTAEAVEALLGYSANLPAGLDSDQVLGALAGVTDPAAVEALLAAAQASGDVECRRAVVTALARIASPASFDVLLGHLQSDPDGVVRCQSMQGLGLIGDARALPALWVAHGSTDPSERSYAWTAIQRIEPGAAGPP